MPPGTSYKKKKKIPAAAKARQAGHAPKAGVLLRAGGYHQDCIYSQILGQQHAALWGKLLFAREGRKEKRIVAAEERLPGGLEAQAWDHLPLRACMREAAAPITKIPPPLEIPPFPQATAPIPPGDSGLFIQFTSTQTVMVTHLITPSLHNQPPSTPHFSPSLTCTMPGFTDLLHFSPPACKLQAQTLSPSK